LVTLFNTEKTFLFRPIDPEGLELIRQSGWSRFPPRLPEQPIFYLVLNEKYVTKFAVSNEYIKRFDIHIVGGSEHAEYWIPAEQLDEFNRSRQHSNAK
jgi:hypothetical protein